MITYIGNSERCLETKFRPTQSAQSPLYDCEISTLKQRDIRLKNRRD